MKWVVEEEETKHGWPMLRQWKNEVLESIFFFLAYSSFHVSLYQKQKAVLIKSKKPSTASTTPTDDINRILVKIPAFWGARWPRHKP